MIRAKKSLGQNFLIDREVLEKITNVVQIKDKTILEVGPGTGIKKESSFFNKSSASYSYVVKGNRVIVNNKFWVGLKSPSE